MPGSGNFSGFTKSQAWSGDFQCHVPINLCLDEFDGDGRQVLYIREQRLLNRDLLDLGDTEFEFGNSTSEAFRFDFNVVVRQVVNFFDGGFDDISVEFFEYRVIITSNAHQLSEDFKADERCFTLVSVGIEVVETDFP